MRWLRTVSEAGGIYEERCIAAVCSIRAETGWARKLTAAVTAAGHRISPEGRYHLAAARALDLPPESYRVRFVPAGEGGTIAIAASDERGLNYAAQTAAELVSTAPTGEIVLTDGPGFTRRGVVEGFYGPPWSHAARLDLLAFMADWRLNIYVYTPKNAPELRRLWRKPFNGKILARFESLAESAVAHGVDFGVAVSPGLSLRYSGEGDYRLLFAKYRQLLNLGVTTFGLYLDDIPEDLVHAADRECYGNLARAQADLANRLYDDLRREAPRICLLFCPTEYHGHAQSDYLHDLGAVLRPEIEVHWTGPRVCSARIDRTDAERVAAVLGRQPLYWDNYPVNDYLMTPELHLQPYRGRARDLAGASRGVLANPMSQAIASRFALATMALYLWRPEGYDPDKAALTVSRALLAEEARAAFVHFTQANAPRMFVRPRLPRAVFSQARRQMEREEIDAGRRTLASEIHRMESTARDLRAHLPAALREEIRSWLAEYEAWTSLGVEGLRLEDDLHVLQRARTARARLAAYLRLERDLIRLKRGLKKSLDWRTGVCGGSLREHLADLAQRVEGLIGLQPVSGALRLLARIAGSILR